MAKSKKEPKNYRTYQFCVSQNHELFGYFDELCFNSKNLYNVTQFYIRQVMSGVKKDKSLRHENEKEVLKLIQACLPQLNEIKQTTHEKKCLKALAQGKDEPKLTLFEMPSSDKWFLSRDLLDGVFKLTKNVDYRSLPTQTSQSIMKQVIQDWKSYFELNKLYKKNPSSLSGKPKLPRYAKKNGRKVTSITNQDAVIYSKEDGGQELKLPKTKLRFDLGKAPIQGKLSEVRVIPRGVGYVLELVCLVPNDEVSITKETARNIVAIDLGVNNFATLTNNIGLEPIIIKGGILKAKNQWYNKQRAHYYGVLRQGKSPKEGPFTSKRLIQMDIKRQRFMKDFFHKVSKQIINYCVDNDIDTLVIGKNNGWKTHVEMRKSDKQNFTNIPYNSFINILEYKAKQAGILFIINEESYTSKASFLDGDTIPTYGEETMPLAFSGKRIKRGLYQSSNGTLINADVNGSANILRKVFPHAFIGGKDSGILKMPKSLLVAYQSPKKKQPLAV